MVSPFVPIHQNCQHIVIGTPVRFAEHFEAIQNVLRTLKIQLPVRGCFTRWKLRNGINCPACVRCTVLCLRLCQGGLRYVRPGSWFSPRSRSSWLSAPHDGFRWWIVSNVVCGLRSDATSQPFSRDRSTSVPSGLRFPPYQRREFRSGSGLLCPLVVSF